MAQRAHHPQRFRAVLPSDPTHVVGIGASAGGIEALQELFQRFNSDNTAFVVVVHLSPGQSKLASVLSRCTAMSVVQAADSQILCKNCVYVIPPSMLLSLTDEGALRLTSLPAVHRSWTIDNFFTSLSEIGSAAAGVILSGTGSDGSLGLQQIQLRGGTTFVQDPDSAIFPQMPANARPFADHCLKPSALGDMLMAVVGAAKKPAEGIN
jgi:two-component system CheB/CheR fusion protein